MFLTKHRPQCFWQCLKKTRTKHFAHDVYFAMFFKAVENIPENLTNFSNTKLRAAFQCQCTLQYLQSKAMWQCKWRHLMTKFWTNQSIATRWPNLPLMQVAPPGDQYLQTMDEAWEILQKCQPKRQVLPISIYAVLLQGNFCCKFTKFYGLQFTGLKMRWNTKKENMRFTSHSTLYFGFSSLLVFILFFLLWFHQSMRLWILSVCLVFCAPIPLQNI